MAEKGDNKKPTISIYDLNTTKRKKRLTVLTDLKTDNFINIKFSYDDIYLAALTNGPDFMMYYYNWENSKIESYVKATNPPNAEGPVLDVSCNVYVITAESIKQYNIWLNPNNVDLHLHNTLFKYKTYQ